MAQMQDNSNIQFMNHVAITSEFINCLKITIPISEDRIKQVYVIPNREYVIRFFDTGCCCNNMVTRTGLVKEIYEDQILFVYDDSTTKGSISEETASKKKCVLFDDPSIVEKYDHIHTVFIPINNIVDIGYSIRGE